MENVKLATLINAEPTIVGQIKLLYRAVSTEPGNLKHWSQLITAKYESGDHYGLETLLMDALGLFPDVKEFWKLLLELAPSLDTFAFALRYTDNSFVWPLLLQYIETSSSITPNELVNIYTHYLEYNEGGLPLVTQALVNKKMDSEAAHLLESKNNFDVANWSLLMNTTDPAVLDKLLFHFIDAVNLFADRLHLLADRKSLLKQLVSAKSVNVFCMLFKASCDWFNQAIPRSPDPSLYMHEYNNILKRRPLQLSSLILQESPNNAEFWIRRAGLWKNSPLVASTVLEEALTIIEPGNVVGNCRLKDVYIRYTNLLFENGTDSERIYAILQKAINDPTISFSDKEGLVCQLALIQEEEEIELVQTTLEKVLNTAQFAKSALIWKKYLETLISLESPKVLQAFNHCCIDEAVSMHIVSMVGSYFSADLVSKMLVFDRGVQLFSMPASLPLWGDYLVALEHHHAEFAQVMQRGITIAQQSKSNYEKFVTMFAERIIFNPLDVRRVVNEFLETSKSSNPRLFLKFVGTYSDPIERRAAFTTAYERTSSVEILQSFLQFELSMNQTARAEALQSYLDSVSNAKANSMDVES